MAPSPQHPLNGQECKESLGINSKNKKNNQIGIRRRTWNNGSLSGREIKVGEELRMRKVDIGNLQEVRWRGQGARLIRVEGKKYKL